MMVGNMQFLPRGYQASCTFIRKDWLEKLNLPVPETTEEFYQTLKAFKEENRQC